MNRLRWSADNMPDCLKNYDGQFATTLWFEAVSKRFHTNCPTGRHFRAFKFHHDSFVASEAVTWLQSELKTDRFKADLSREQTLSLIQMLQRLEKMFVDVRGKRYEDETIQDNGTIYRFCDYKAFADWGFPRNEEVTEQKQDLCNAPDLGGPSKPVSEVATSQSFDKDRQTTKLLSSPELRKAQFVSMSNARKASRTPASGLFVRQAVERRSDRINGSPALHRLNSVSRRDNAISKPGEMTDFRNRVQSMVVGTRKELTNKAGLRETSSTNTFVESCHSRRGVGIFRSKMYRCLANVHSSGDATGNANNPIVLQSLKKYPVEG